MSIVTIYYIFVATILDDMLMDYFLSDDVMCGYMYIESYQNIFFRWILKNDIVDETNQPEDKDKDEEKHRIDDPDEGLAEINLPVSLILAPCLGLGDWSLSESVDVGLH